MPEGLGAPQGWDGAPQASGGALGRGISLAVAEVLRGIAQLIGDTDKSQPSTAPRCCPQRPPRTQALLTPCLISS